MLYDWGMMLRLLLSLALITCSGSVASAEEVEATQEVERREHFEAELDAAYFWDGGALPFVYGSLAVGVGLRLFVTPPDTPRLFSASEGGATTFDDTVPSYAVGLYAGAGAGLIALLPTSARLHHLKGYSEAVLTTMALTEIAKNFFGRHRPLFQEGDEDPDHRRSFFSGHASITAASTVYFGLYLHQHIGPRLRGPRAGLYKALAFTLLGGALVGVPISRVRDNRHHLSDVLTGAFAGSAMAALFYAYQESRYQDDREELYGAKRSRLVLVPDLDNRGLSLMTSW